MRQSDLLTKTQKSPPAGEISVNAQLLERGGFITKLMSGVYSYLPLGVRVLRNIENEIREAMNGIGGQEVFLPALQPQELWETTGRWQGLREVMYQFTDPSKRTVGLAVTHEEVVASIIKTHITSYADLPKALYQIQTKFRHEPRAKAGLIRGREFSMKDLYSCHATQRDCDDYYETVKKTYNKLFTDLGLSTHIVEASGGSFSEAHSHEFQVVSDAGEDRVLLCDACGWAQNTEYAKDRAIKTCPSCKKKSVSIVKAIEVGNIFKLGTRFTEPFEATFMNKSGNVSPIIMASYGIGVSRALGTIVEVHHDDRGICWPESVSPFFAHCILLGKEDSVKEHAERFYVQCQKAGIDVLFDDRADVATGEKLNDADLLGIPHRLIFSARQGTKMEYKLRSGTEVKSLSATIAALRDL